MPSSNNVLNNLNFRHSFFFFFILKKIREKNEKLNENGTKKKKNAKQQDLFRFLPFLYRNYFNSEEFKDRPNCTREITSEIFKLKT